MKKLRNLTLKQKRFLEEQKLNPEEYLSERIAADHYVFYNKNTEKLMIIRR